MNTHRLMLLLKWVEIFAMGVAAVALIVPGMARRPPAPFHLVVEVMAMAVVALEGEMQYSLTTMAMFL